MKPLEYSVSAASLKSCCGAKSSYNSSLLYLCMCVEVEWCNKVYKFNDWKLWAPAPSYALFPNRAVLEFYIPLVGIVWKNAVFCGSLSLYASLTPIHHDMHSLHTSYTEVHACTRHKCAHGELQDVRYGTLTRAVWSGGLGARTFRVRVAGTAGWGEWANQS